MITADKFWVDVSKDDYSYMITISNNGYQGQTLTTYEKENLEKIRDALSDYLDKDKTPQGEVK